MCASQDALGRGFLPRGGVCLGVVSAQMGVCLPGGIDVSAQGGGLCPLPVNRMTDACENFTLVVDGNDDF